MKEAQEWWNQLTSRLENDPVYIAESISNGIAIQVHEALKEQNINQKELSRRMQVSTAYVSQVLGGKTNLTIASLCKIAVALDLVPRVELDYDFAKRALVAKSDAKDPVLDTNMTEADTASAGIAVQHQTTLAEIAVSANGVNEALGEELAGCFGVANDAPLRRPSTAFSAA